MDSGKLVPYSPGQAAGITGEPIRGGWDCRGAASRAAAELSLEGGSQGKGGGGGKHIPQAFLAPDRDRGVREKGRGASQTPG